MYSRGSLMRRLAEL